MARNPVTGAIYPWYNDAVNAGIVADGGFGNGQITNIRDDDVTIQFEYWTGTLDNKKWIRRLVTIDRATLKGNWTNRFGGYWDLRPQDVD